MKHNITLTSNQCKIILKALDNYIRLGLGQYNNVIDNHIFITNQEKREKLNVIYNKLKHIINNHIPGESFGIYQDCISNDYRIAYDIEQVIRYHIAWLENPEGGRTVNFYAPMKSSTSKEELPSICVEKENTKQK